MSILKPPSRALTPEEHTAVTHLLREHFKKDERPVTERDPLLASPEEVTARIRLDSQIARAEGAIHDGKIEDSPEKCLRNNP